MPWRAIHDDIGVSDSLNGLSDFAFRLWVMMLAQADPCGRLPGSVTKIKTYCIPRLSVSDEQTVAALEELVQCGRIVLYLERGIYTCQLLGFDENQPLHLTGEIRHSRFPARPEHPPPQQNSGGSPPLQQQLKGVSDLTTEASYDAAELSIEKSGEADLAMTLLLAEISDATESTRRFLRKKRAEGLSASAFYDAREALRSRRQSGRSLRSDARFVNSVLTAKLEQVRASA